MSWQGIYNIIITSDEKSELFRDEAADVGEGTKDSKKQAKSREAENNTDQPKKKRRHKKDEEYGVSRGKQTC